MSDSRSALIVDSEEGQLGEAVTMRLLRLGIDVFYAKGADEAQLLARQEARNVFTLLFPATFPFDSLVSICDGLRARRDDEPLALVVVGERPDEAERARLRKFGVEWAIWEPYDDSALRAVVSNAMAAAEVNHNRREPRTPTTLLGRAFVDTQRKDVIVSSLSSRGAFLETPAPFDPGSQISLGVALPGGPLDVEAEVAYSRDARDSSWPAGMGVTFAKLDPESEERLSRFLEALRARFAV